MTFPFQDPALDLSPTAERLLASARSILAEKGLPSLSIKAVTSRCGENLAAVHYHFKSKRGLLRALLDSHTFAASIALLERARNTPPGPERVDTWIDGLRQISEDDESFVAFFEL